MNANRLTALLAICCFVATIDIVIAQSIGQANLRSPKPVKASELICTQDLSSMVSAKNQVGKASSIAEYFANGQMHPETLFLTIDAKRKALRVRTTKSETRSLTISRITSEVVVAMDFEYAPKTTLVSIYLVDLTTGDLIVTNAGVGAQSPLGTADHFHCRN